MAADQGRDGKLGQVKEREMPLADLLAWAIPSLPTWDAVEASIRSNLCLCCGRPGHYQEMMDAHVAAHGLEGMGVYVNEKRQLDGNHRLIAARRAGITTIPLETKQEAGERWVRAHGKVNWLGRKTGDISPEEMAWLTFDVLHRLAPWPSAHRELVSVARDDGNGSKGPVSS